MSRSRSRSPIRRGGGSDSGGHRRDRGDRGGGGGGGRGRIDHRSDRMVYLSNLPWELKWMELKDIIREKAGEVNFVEVLEERDGRSKGCAVVEFKHREDAIKCIDNMHRTELRDRLIVAKEIRDPVAFFRKVKDDTGIDFLGGGDRPERSRAANNSGAVNINESDTYGLSPNFLRQLGISTPLGNRVFMTNIPYTCSVGRLFDVCALAGKITWLDLQMDKEGKSKGMAVIEYSHPIEAVQAVSMLNNQRMIDRNLAVRMDRYQKEIERREPGGLPFGLRGVGMGLGANGAPLTDVASVISSINPTAVHLNGNASNGPFVSTLSQPQVAWPTAPQPAQAIAIPMMQTQPIMQAAPTAPVVGGGGYPQAGGATPIVPAVDHGSGGGGHFPSQYQSHSSGGFFTTPPAVTQTPVRSTPGVPQYVSSGGGSGGGGGQFMPKTQHGFGSTPQAAANQPVQVKYESYGGGYSSGQSGAANVVGGTGGGGAVGGGGGGHYEASRVILIKNLPVDYTWQIVSDRVQQFGDLESVEMITPGVAKVRFMQLKDSERAKNALQGTTVEGRAIGIEYL